MSYYSNRNQNNDQLLCKYQHAIDEIMEAHMNLTKVLYKYKLLEEVKDVNKIHDNRE